MPSWPSLVWPTIGAESPAGVAAALAASLAPPESNTGAPAWLWPSQCKTFRQVLAAISRYGGALLADPVGTGKTYVALAAAGAVNGSRPTVCLVPAALREQWSHAARRTGVPIVPWSHERASRGSLPPNGGRLAVIDESHRLRNPATRGYGYVARWLLGRRALLLSATPVVNRLADLAHQLRLAVRDDALAPQGVASIGRLLDAGYGHPALGRVVLSAAASPACRPNASELVERPSESDEALERMLSEIDRLGLSPEPSVAALIRCMLWRAAASSPAALDASLRRYRRLLLHARDAAGAGHRLTRQSLVQLGGLGDQVIMWELLPGTDQMVDLVTDDTPLLDSLIARSSTVMNTDDSKLARLRSILADGRSTLVFTVSRETVRWLRDRLGPQIAWCTGERAGIGRAGVSRRAVFAWFGAEAPTRRRESAEGWHAPVHLVSTDVAAEGLDLQGASRVVHYDLPWTPMRMDQRSGRVVRAGSPHAAVEVLRFEPAPALERRLRQTELLARKARLPALVGLGERSAAWRWGRELAGWHLRGGNAAAVRGVAAVSAEPRGMLAGFTLQGWPDDGGPPVAAHVLWWDQHSGWTEAPGTVAERLETACAAPAAAVPLDAVRRSLTQIGEAVRDRLRVIRRGAWECPPPGPAARALLARLDPLVRAAARRRDPVALALVQRAIRFAAGGHTAGESLELERLARLGEPELRAAFGGLPPPTAAPSTLQARVSGVILFVGRATFPPCRRSAPSCSTSMAR